MAQSEKYFNLQITQEYLEQGAKLHLGMFYFGK